VPIAEPSTDAGVFTILKKVNLFTPRKVYTVSEITALIKDLLEGEFPDLWIEGEISNYSAPSSGHLYFVLKDKGAQIKCACFRQRARLLKFRPEDGLKVFAIGHIGVYEPRGEYQLYVESLEPKGLGALQLAFEQLKAKLQEEGLFDPARKKALPLLPRAIGIVTSPTGAALQDILRILRRRHQNVRVLIYPSKVQGEGASDELAAGIAKLNTLPEIDVLIVGRGGGSVEDLWAFNEEVLARAIAGSRIPVISAVGHEVDFTIADFVADLRAPTPSSAAEMVVLKKSELIERVAGLEQRVAQSIQIRISETRNRILSLAVDRAFASVEGRLQRYQQRTDELTFRMETALPARLSKLRSRWQLLTAFLQRYDIRQSTRIRRETVRSHEQGLSSHLHLLLQVYRRRAQSLESTLMALNPMAVLERGYAICRNRLGNVVKDSGTMTPGELFTVTLARGRIEGEVKGIK
jgi:exodeoxyribonuclease VII large subunit